MACETTRNSVLSPNPGILLSPVELAKIDYRAVDGYDGGFFSPDLITATTDQAQLIVEVAISNVGEEPKMPRWVAGYEARDFVPYNPEEDPTLDELDWIRALIRTTWDGVVSEKMVANAAKICADDIRTTQEFRRLNPHFTVPQARVVRAALGFTAAKAPDPIERLQASIARLRYADLPHTTADFLLGSRHVAIGLFRRLAAIAL